MGGLCISQALLTFQRRLLGGKLWFFLFRLVVIPYLLVTLAPKPSAFDLIYESLFTVCVAVHFMMDIHASLWQGGDVRIFLFHLLGALAKVSVREARDPKVMDAVLKASNHKGCGLEYFMALPAWSPIRSLESIDGEEWKVAHGRMRNFMRVLPPASALEDICTQVLDRLLSKGHTLDASGIVRYTLESLLLYVFNRPWEPRFELFVEASWGWRREIALKGRAGDELKARAITLLLDLIRESPLWELYGEEWADPSVYSLIAQPLLISPSINVSDIAVTMKRHPGMSIEDSIRTAHPFPVLERFLEHELTTTNLKGEEVHFPAGTQVVAFLDTAPWSTECRNWAPFGSGVRQCTGRLQAMSLMRPLAKAMADNNHSIEPEQGHLYSGRHNDNKNSFDADLFFAKAVCVAFWRAWQSRPFTDKL
eukprot:c15197_g1_i1.p1 GENE.c15197_g1_i1~~c15197_g1_i1.p1  ORF type:complete len:493 (+),score=84.04 c15197_g1_i1:211-1479(+)